ncbi:MAG: DUF5106 domain-containing protein [Mucinivorans sp.]
MRQLIILFIAGCLLGSCSEPQQIPKHPIKFKMVEVPTALSSQKERVEFVIQNYWKSYNFADTTLIQRQEFTEQAFADFIQILFNITPEQARVAIDKQMQSAIIASQEMFDHFCSLYQKYLYDPNSPMRNEELYMVYLQSILSNPLVETTMKIRPEYQLEMALKNRKSTKTADFNFTDSHKHKNSLYNSLKERTILFFNNPDCHNCAQVKQQMASSIIIEQLSTQGRLQIVSIYVDEDMGPWFRQADQVPVTWINGYTKGTGVQMSTVYDLRAIPTLYLLDGQGIVLLKDAPFEQIEAFLDQENS